MLRRLAVIIVSVVSLSGHEAVAGKPARVDLHGDPLPSGAIAGMGTTRWRHIGRVFAIAYSPDGKLLASSGQDSTARLWDVKSGREVRRLAGTDLYLDNLAFSPDGTIIAGAGKGLWLWETATGKLVQCLQDAKQRVLSLAWSPNGKGLVSSGDDGTIYVWDSATRKELRRLLGHQGSVFTVAFSPDAKRLASGGADSVIRFWNVSTGKEDGRKPVSREWIRSLSFSTDGTRIAYAMDWGRIHVWDVAKGKEVSRDQSSFSCARSLAYSPNGKLLAVGGGGGGYPAYAVDVWRTADKEWVRLARTTNFVNQIVFSPDSQTLAGASMEGVIRFWNTSTGKEIDNAPGHSYRIDSLAISPDGRRVVSGSDDLRQWDLSNGKEITNLRTKHLFSSFSSVIWSPDGKLLASAVGSDIELRNPTNAKIIHSLHASNSITGLAFAPDSKVLASAEYDGRLALWETGTGKQIRVMKANEDRVNTIVFSADGKLLLSGGQGGSIRLWDVASGKETGVLRGHEDWVWSLALSADGRTLASVDTGSIVVRDASSQEVVRRLYDPEKKGLYSVSLSADGALLAAGGGAGNIQLWEVASGQLIRTFRGHLGRSSRVAFCPDGRTIVSGNEDHTLLVWDVSGWRESGYRPPERLSPAERDGLWKELVDQDAVKAQKALWTLASIPRETVPLLRQRLTVAVPADRAKITRWITQLDSSRFEAREAAQKNLERLEEMAFPALREAQANRPSLEMRRRLERILERGRTGIPSPESLRSLRAIRVLEQIGTPDACELLGELAKGAAEARLTREAIATWNRIQPKKGD